MSEGGEWRPMASKKVEKEGLVVREAWWWRGVGRGERCTRGKRFGKDGNCVFFCIFIFHLGIKVGNQPKHPQLIGN